MTPTSPRPVRTTVFRQAWLDLAFVHWALDPDVVAPLLPTGVRPDVLDGATPVGLVAFRMRDIGIGPSPAIPYFGSFAETNVRLYTVDEAGRRGVFFLSLDATRLVPVLVARALGVPYRWSRMSVTDRTQPGTRAGGGGRRRHDQPAGRPVRGGGRRAERAGAVRHRPLGAAPVRPDRHGVLAERAPGVAAAPGRAAGARRRAGRRGRAAAAAGCADERALVAGGTGPLRAEAGGAGRGQAGARRGPPARG